MSHICTWLNLSIITWLLFLPGDCQPCLFFSGGFYNLQCGSIIGFQISSDRKVRVTIATVGKVALDRLSAPSSTIFFYLQYFCRSKQAFLDCLVVILVCADWAALYVCLRVFKSSCHNNNGFYDAHFPGTVKHCMSKTDFFFSCFLPCFVTQKGGKKLPRSRHEKRPFLELWQKFHR